MLIGQPDVQTLHCSDTYTFRAVSMRNDCIVHQVPYYRKLVELHRSLLLHKLHKSLNFPSVSYILCLWDFHIYAIATNDMMNMYSYDVVYVFSVQFCRVYFSHLCQVFFVRLCQALSPFSCLYCKNLTVSSHCYEKSSLYSYIYCLSKIYTHRKIPALPVLHLEPKLCHSNVYTIHLDVKKPQL